MWAISKLMFTKTVRDRGILIVKDISDRRDTPGILGMNIIDQCRAICLQ